MKFAELYPDEVAGFVGLDNSVPGQQRPEDYEGDLSADGGLHPTMTVLRFMGVARVERWINGDESVFFPANPLLNGTEQNQDWLLDNAKLDLRLLDNEESWFLRNDLDLAGHRIDAAIPTLMLLAEDTVQATREFDMPDWVEVHQAAASENSQSRIATLPGSHLLYLEAPDRVVAEIRQFLAEEK
jgi:pimeloyl-ACP methyl ester carboxylesterase